MDEQRAKAQALRRMIKRGVYLLLFLILIGALVIASLPKPVSVERAQVVRGGMRVTVDEDGQARVKDRYVVSAPIFGSLARIEYESGDAVNQGQVLARIEPVQPALLDTRARISAEARLAQTLAAQQQASAQIERAQTTLELAKSELVRAKQLFEREAGSRQALEQAENNERRALAELSSLRFATRVAKFEVEMARAAIERLPGEASSRRRESKGKPLSPAQLNIPSPVSGRVLKVFHKSEGVVQAGAQLLEVGDPEALEVVVDVLTSDAARITSGAPVTLDRWGGPAVQGRVRRVESSAFTRLSALGVEEQRVNVLIDLTSPQKEWAALGDGYRVEAHIVVWEGAQVVQVPASTVFRHGDGWALFRIEGNIARITPVSLGQRTMRDVQIESGLSGGETIIVHPSDKVSDGVKVASQ
ncbi:MAG: HlyD family efflux transporter periplasmic adaptor subunit [Myxococcales bacterium]|nr:HlyD family efflux transporter periplasmic adaptor subunit [Myxococcales bacterium]